MEEGAVFAHVGIDGPTAPPINVKVDSVENGGLLPAARCALSMQANAKKGSAVFLGVMQVVADLRMRPDKGDAALSCENIAVAYTAYFGAAGRTERVKSPYSKPK